MTIPTSPTFVNSSMAIWVERKLLLDYVTNSSLFLGY